MKKYLMALLALATLAFTACEKPVDPDPTPDPDPQPTVTSFPRKHLIEHFTGEECGYCPYGMASIEAFLAKTNKNYIWVSHHYGYGTDEYSIAANTTIGKKLSVSGAPNVVFDRTKRKVNGTTAYAFHPGYLTETGAVPLNDADTSLVSVVINHSYDAATRELQVIVSGQVLDTAMHTLKLSALIKESGTVGAQHDYYGSWEGWSEFRHVKTVRAMLTAALGDQVEVDSVSHTYSDTLTYTVPAEWVANNCCVVAYVTENSSLVKPILNAEQAPMVAGTDGGESLKAEGITAVPVSDDYPEEGSPNAQYTFSSLNINTSNQATYGYVTVVLQSTETKKVDGYACTPYLQLYVFTKTAELAAGTYPISDEAQYGVVAAGYKDEEQFDVNGSMLYYVYNYQGSLYPMAKWLLRSGELVIGEDGSYSINATTLNGSTFSGTYTPATAAPMRLAPMANKLQRSLFFINK